MISSEAVQPRFHSFYASHQAWAGLLDKAVIKRTTGKLTTGKFQGASAIKIYKRQPCSKVVWYETEVAGRQNSHTRILKQCLAKCLAALNVFPGQTILKVGKIREHVKCTFRHLHYRAHILQMTVNVFPNDLEYPAGLSQVVVYIIPTVKGRNGRKLSRCTGGGKRFAGNNGHGIQQWPEFFRKYEGAQPPAASSSPFA